MSRSRKLTFHPDIPERERPAIRDGYEHMRRRLRIARHEAYLLRLAPWEERYADWSPCRLGSMTRQALGL